jgi:(R,R)-butanediol dehydrogenase/meso-butanediol dehydrogenase/diacetyl reductase
VDRAPVFGTGCRGFESLQARHPKISQEEARRGRFMKAAVLHGAGDIRAEDFPVPEVQPGGVLIKVKSCGICGSDLHGYRHGGREGMRLGHEFAGDIVEVGAGVKGVKRGDRVIAMSGKGCGECYWCRKGDFIRCSKLELLGYGIPGALAEYVVVPSFKVGRYADRLPDNISYDEGTAAEPIAVALYAVRQVKPKTSDIVVVVGLGIIGLCIIPILKSMGVGQVIAAGRREQRLKIAKDFGADVVIDAAREDIVPIVKRIDYGKGADIVFDCAGSTATFQQSLNMVHRGGKIDLVGLYQEPITWNPTFLVSNDISLIGCGLKWDLPGGLDLIKKGIIDVKPLITHRFPLSAVKKAFDTQLKLPDAIKVVVNP